MFYLYIEIGVIIGLIFALVFLLTCIKDTHRSVKILGPMLCIITGMAWLPGVVIILIYLIYRYITEFISNKKQHDNI